MAVMNDRDRSRGRRPARPGKSGRPGSSGSRVDDPALPDDVAASDLDADTRRDLLTLDKANAESVARHLVMVSQLLYEEPTLALEHARAARRRASRVGVVRETAGIAAYNAGEWQEAISELRAARRITGSPELLPLIADAERGLGRPDRAVEIARGDEARTLTGDVATEMRLVEAGARIDLGEPEKALVTLQLEDLKPSRSGTEAARLFYTYASALEAAGRIDDASTWYMNAAAADIEDATDAEFRLMELANGEEVGEAAEALEAPEPETAAQESPRPVPAQPADSKPTETKPAETEPADTEPADTEPAGTQPANDEVAETIESPEPVVQPVAEQSADIAAEQSADTAAEAPADTETTASLPSLESGYDALLLDLDGTVFAGKSPVTGAVAALAAVSVPTLFVTNNASRRPSEVADHLQDMGFEATPEQVVTSAQTAARLLAEHLEPGSRALVLGTDGLVQEVREVGIAVTRSAADRPLAVIQGFSPDTSWEQLSEAALAIRAGALWVATNVDATLPSERGLLVGNGSLVAAVANATDQEPLVAGKPAAPLMADAIARSKAQVPLVVGDRLDTDIQGAHAVGLDSLLVLSGVASPADLLSAAPQHRPTFVAAGLASLGEPAAASKIAESPRWVIDADANSLTVAESPDTDSVTDLLPALAATVWRLADGGDLDLAELVVSSPDPAVQQELESLGLTGAH